MINFSKLLNRSNEDAIIKKKGTTCNSSSSSSSSNRSSPTDESDMNPMLMVACSPTNSSSVNPSPASEGSCLIADMYIIVS